MSQIWKVGQAGLTCVIAVALLTGCAGISPFDTVDSLMREGQNLYLAQKYDEAIAKFEQVIAKDKTYWMAYLSVARCQMAKGNWLPAIESARKAYELAPTGTDVVTVFGGALFGGGLDALKQGQFSDAIRNFVEYIRVVPSDPRGYLNAGKAYLGNGAFGDALRVLVQGLVQAGAGETRQELIQSLLDGGVSALSQGDAKDAVGFLQQYLQRDPGNPSALLNLGKAYWQSGERLQALNSFRRALELSPGNEEALRFLQGFGR